jgi:hypothetical protein
MKKIIIILIVLFTITLGALYNTPAQLVNLKQGTTYAVDMNPFNYEMPYVVVDTMPVMPLMP